MADSTQQEKKGNRGLMFFTIFLLVTNIATLVLYLTQREENKELITNNTDLNTERDKLKLELEEMLAQYDSVSTDNAEMQAQIAEQRAEIEKLLKEAEKHKDDAYIIYKLRKEANQLREVIRRKRLYTSS